MKTTSSGVFTGLRAPLRGVRFVLGHRALLRIALAPIAINTVLFGCAIAVFVANFDVLLAASTGFLELEAGSGFWHGVLDWLASGARFLIGAVIAVVFAVVVFFGFTMIGNIIAAPFNEILSVRTEALVLEQPIEDQGASFLVLYREARYAIGTEFRRILFYLSVAIPIFFVGWIPAVGQIIAPVAGFLVTAYFLAFDYTDPVMSRRHLGLADKRLFLKAHRSGIFGFGAASLGIMAIPFVNLLLLPAQVVTGTLLYLEWSGESNDVLPFAP